MRKADAVFAHLATSLGGVYLHYGREAGEGDKEAEKELSYKSSSVLLYSNKIRKTIYPNTLLISNLATPSRPETLHIYLKYRPIERIPLLSEEREGEQPST